MPKSSTPMPNVSVIIPTFNHALYLGRALKSVLDQTYTNWEVIIIDNHSSDNTDEVIASYADPRIRTLYIHNNGVIAASRNAGIQSSKGQWIAFLDSDDWWTTDKLHACLERTSDKVDLIYHDLELMSDQSRTFKQTAASSRQVEKPVLMDLLLKGNAIANSSVVVRKSMLDKIGGINESTGMIGAEDYNTWLCIAQLTNQFLYLPLRLGYYFTHNTNISRKDMSQQTRSAISEFRHLLGEKQNHTIEGNISYTRGRLQYLSGNYSHAKSELYSAIRYGHSRFVMKSLWMLLVIHFLMQT